MPRRSASAAQRLAWEVGRYLNRPVWVRRTASAKAIAGKRILITGASSGIGRAAARRFAADGARVIVVARRESELAVLQQEITRSGGEAVHHSCDLSDPADVDALVRRAHDEYGGVDILINNAGRSARRPIVDSLDRLKDFRRAMAVNYFGPVHLTVGLLPAMLARRSGHVINVGTWTVPVGTSPRFAAYHSSKAALTGFGRCVDAELAAGGVHVTEVHYPLVHTPMSAPTDRYSNLPGLTPDEAAAWLATAVKWRPARMTPRFTVGLRMAGLVSSRLVDRLLLRFG